MEADDDERLSVLRGFEILDTAPEEQFDALVRLAGYICGTPMAAVSLVDEHRQWFKARIGLPVVETPRGDAFCSRTIAQRDVFEVPDAAADPRFADNPLVTGPPHVGFYAAAPLVTPDGFALGTLCVLDHGPRRLDDGQRAALQSLAAQTMDQIVLHQQVLVTRRLEERFRALVERSADLIAVIEPDGTLRYISPAVREILGYEPDDPALRNRGTAIDDPEAQAMIRAALASEPGEEIKAMELPLRRKDGSVAYLDVRATNLTDDPAVGAVVFNARDVTEVRRAESDLEHSRRQAVQVLETANDAYIQSDGDGRITEWNHQATTVFGWERHEAVGRRMVDLIVPERYREAHVGGLRRASSRIARVGDTLVNGLAVSAVRRDGTELPVEITLWSTTTPELGTRFSAFVRDVTERRALEEQLEHHALHDDLTGLANRYLLRDRLEIALARAEHDGRSVGVVFLDLDQFKVVNESSGHSVGDAVLIEVARRLEATVRPADTVVRFGGDEFVVVVDGVDDELEVSALAEDLRVALTERLAVDGLDVPTGVSIGYVVGAGGADPERLVSDADAAMYLAKERGRNRIEAFGAELHTRVRARMEDERALRHALEGDELRVAYQPILSLDTEQIIGAEALVRWERPGHGVLLPASFIPLAEETGLVVELGSWVLGQATDQLRAWQRRFPGRGLSVSVNVSARQIAAPGFASLVADTLDRSGVEPGTVTLELTESTLMEDLGRSATTLTRLRDAGVRTAIDDFGTGYSSLAYLKALPIDILKVDRAFVAGLGIDPYDSAIVSAISTIARELGLQVVAEGVETAEQLDHLRAQGCHAAQGYLFARPMWADALIDLLGQGVS